jgi:hypothetical protein
MKKIRVLMLMLMSLAFAAVASSSSGIHKQTSVDGLARGHPIATVVSKDIVSPMPGIIETIRKVRDVDTGRFIDSPNKKKVAIQSVTVNRYSIRASYDCRVWRQYN